MGNEVTMQVESCRPSHFASRQLAAKWDSSRDKARGCIFEPEIYPCSLFCLLAQCSSRRSCRGGNDND